MTETHGRRAARARVLLCGLLTLSCAAAFSPGSAGAAAGRGSRASRAQGERLDIRLRSFVPPASGQLTIEPSPGGGAARLTALRLPDPRSQSRDARTYVVWANSGARIVRLGELRRDARGNGGLAFSHPSGFDRYTLLVTAEPSDDVERPFGAPVLSTRANEATSVFGSAPAPAGRAAAPPPPAAHSNAGGFYAEVEEAIEAGGGGRLVELEGSELAPRARARARTAERANNAYVIVRFNDVPLPHAVNASAYVMWGILPDGRILYMGSLPADRFINGTDTYVRAPGFDSPDFELFVTAEQRRPASSPSDRRALSTRHARNVVK